MVRRYYPESVDAALVRLAQKVEGLSHQVGQWPKLQAQVDSHGRAITHLTGLLQTAGPAPAAPGQPAAAAGQPMDGGAGGPDDDLVPEWMSVSDPAQAVAWLSDLTVWMTKIWVRYPNGTMPKCWPWHPAAVTELLVARHLWAAATLPGQGVDALATWHDRWRPATLVRVSRVMSGCERAQGCHTNVTMKHWRFDLDLLDDLAVWWAASSSNPNVDYESAPGLTYEERHPDRIPTVDVRARGRR